MKCDNEHDWQEFDRSRRSHDSRPDRKLQLFSACLVIPLGLFTLLQGTNQLLQILSTVTRAKV
jgi:hypothetical protein